MPAKTLLVALTTNRTTDGESKRVRFAAGQTVNLTKAELEMLDKMTVSTGVLHYRDPVNESATDDGEEIAERKFIGENVAIGKKNVDQLKAFLTFYKVEFADDASKADLQTAAGAVDVEAAKGDDDDSDDDDQDSGL